MIKTKAVGPFPLGKDTVSDENNMPKGSLREALNIDINDAGWPQRRTGYNLLYSGTNIHSLYKRYFMEGGDLKYLNADNTATVIRSGLSPDRILSYTEVNNEIYCSNGLENFTLNGEWGIPTPSGKPVLATTTGNMPAGTYQIVVCWQDSKGVLSGATVAQRITLSANQGIALSNLPQSPDGYDCAIYMTNTNGEGLYYQTVVPNGSTLHNIYGESNSGKVLATQFSDKTPPGQIIRYFKGRIFVADGSVLWFTDAYNYNLYTPSTNFIMYPERITVLEPTEGGMFVCSDKTYYLTGTNPADFVQSTVTDARGVEGTGLRVFSGDFGLDFSTRIPFWWSSEGAILGLPNGQIKRLTEGRLAHDEVLSGSSMYREIDGIKQVVTSLKQGRDTNGFGAIDYATATVIRNGVVI